MEINKENQNKLKIEELQRLLNYDKDTGIFTNKISRGSKGKDTIAGNLYPSGYRLLQINKIKYLEHRLAWFYVYGTWPEKELDHRVRDHNWIDNLREATRSENHANIPSKNKLKGVRLRKSKWIAEIKYKGKSYHLGAFKTEKEAAIEYNKAAILLFGDFALQN